MSDILQEFRTRIVAEEVQAEREGYRVMMTCYVCCGQISWGARQYDRFIDPVYLFAYLERARVGASFQEHPSCLGVGVNQITREDCEQFIAKMTVGEIAAEARAELERRAEVERKSAQTT